MEHLLLTFFYVIWLNEGPFLSHSNFGPFFCGVLLSHLSFPATFFPESDDILSIPVRHLQIFLLIRKKSDNQIWASLLQVVLSPLMSYMTEPFLPLVIGHHTTEEVCDILSRVVASLSKSWILQQPIKLQALSFPSLVAFIFYSYVILRRENERFRRREGWWYSPKKWWISTHDKTVALMRPSTHYNWSCSCFFSYPLTVK